MSLKGERHTVLVFVIILGKLCVKSTQGLIKTAPAGMGMPKSRSTVSTVKDSPAPAESPVIWLIPAIKRWYWTRTCENNLFGSNWLVQSTRWRVNEIKVCGSLDENMTPDVRDRTHKLRSRPATDTAMDTAALCYQESQ